MDSLTEGRVLRLAITKGLLTWDDLDAVAGRVVRPDGAPPGVPPDGAWLQEAGQLRQDLPRERGEAHRRGGRPAGRRRPLFRGARRLPGGIPLPHHLAALPHRKPPRRRRHGHRLPRLRSLLEPACRAQVPAPQRRPAGGGVPARGPCSGPRRTPAPLPGLRGRRGGGTAVHRDAVHRGAEPRRAARQAAAGSSPCGSSATSRAPSTPPTRPASSTATSSRPTSWSPPARRASPIPMSWTSAWRRTRGTPASPRAA